MLFKVLYLKYIYLFIYFSPEKIREEDLGNIKVQLQLYGFVV